MGSEANKKLVRRLVEVITSNNVEVLDDIADGPFALVARQWIAPFKESFPDFKMEIVDLVAESEKVAAHFKCSGTHEGDWMGYPPTGRRFEGVDEIYIFRTANGKLVSATAVEDNLARMRQLGFYPLEG